MVMTRAPRLAILGVLAGGAAVSAAVWWLGGPIGWWLGLIVIVLVVWVIGWTGRTR
jgi:hypothetical protein